MPDTYTHAFRVRFDECGHDSAARSATLLRYVAETAFAHSAAVGYPLSWYLSAGLFWLVRAAHMQLAIPAVHAETLEVTTRVIGVRRVWARRLNTIRRADGEAVGTVTMDWILTDHDGRPARIPPSMVAAFPGLPGDLQRLQVAPMSPPDDALVGRHTVSAHESDPRGHMNNAAYLDVFDDAVGGLEIDPQARPARYDLQYLRAVRSGERLQFAAWTSDAGTHLAAHVADGPTAWQGTRARPDAPVRCGTERRGTERRGCYGPDPDSTGGSTVPV